MRYLAACHATAQFRRIICLQHHHVETCQHSVHVVIVKNARGQAIQILQWTDCLRQFLVRAIADFLLAYVIWQENRQLLALFKVCPVCISCTTRTAVFIDTRDVWDNKTRCLWQGRANFCAAGRLIFTFAGALADVWLILMMASVHVRCKFLSNQNPSWKVAHL